MATCPVFANDRLEGVNDDVILVGHVVFWIDAESHMETLGEFLSPAESSIFAETDTVTTSSFEVEDVGVFEGVWRWVLRSQTGSQFAPEIHHKDECAEWQWLIGIGLDGRVDCEDHPVEGFLDTFGFREILMTIRGPGGYHHDRDVACRSQAMSGFEVVHNLQWEEILELIDVSQQFLAVELLIRPSKVVVLRQSDQLILAKLEVNRMDLVKENVVTQEDSDHLEGFHLGSADSGVTQLGGQERHVGIADMQHINVILRDFDFVDGIPMEEGWNLPWKTFGVAAFGGVSQLDRSEELGATQVTIVEPEISVRLRGFIRPGWADALIRWIGVVVVGVEASG